MNTQRFQYLCSKLPEGVMWGDALTPETVEGILSNAFGDFPANKQPCKWNQMFGDVYVTGCNRRSTRLEHQIKYCAYCGGKVEL